MMSIGSHALKVPEYAPGMASVNRDKEMMVMKALIQTAGILALSTLAATTQAKVVIFDDNLGGAAKAGSVETAVGAYTNLQGDVWGPVLTFSDFTVTGGFSHSVNLAGRNFNKNNQITMGSLPYQDLKPQHGGLGSLSLASGGANSDTDNLQPNLITGAVGDEILFFDFGTSVVLDTVWFNGSHTEHTAFTNNGRNDAGDALFTLFYSADGVAYQATGPQTSPMNQEYLLTGITSAYSHWAVAATGWNSAPGGYVEAIRYATVPEPATLALLGLGLAGLGLRRRK